MDEENYVTCIMGASFSREIGKHGLKPTIIDEMLADKHVYGPNVSLGYYTRNFDGECSPSDLETALQVKPHELRLYHAVCFPSDGHLPFNMTLFLYGPACVLVVCDPN